MGSYAELYTSDENIPNFTIQEDCIALCSKYLMPVFWFCLFDRDDYKLIVPICDEPETPEDEPGQHPVLISELKIALERYDSRKESIFEVIPENWKKLWISFRDYLSSNPLKYIHFDQQQLAGMMPEYDGCMDDWKKSIFDCLSAFNDEPWINPKGFLSSIRKPKLSYGYRELLATADISFRKIDKIEWWKLAGSGEGANAPWEDLYANQ